MHSRAVCVGFVILPLSVLLGCAGVAPHTPDTPAPTAAAPAPPVAETRPFSVLSPHGARVDEYYWLRDDTRTDKAVLGYLEAENAYMAAMTAHTRALADRVYEETVARIQQDDSTVPYRKRSYWYYTRYEAGSEHPIYARKVGTLEAPEQVMLDASELARGHGYYAVGEYAIAPNDRLLAYVDDTVGRRQYTLRFKDLATGKTLPDAIPNVESYLAWNADSTSVLYVEKNPVTLLGYRVRRHVLGSDPARDPLVYEQDDLSFYTSVTTTKDGRFLLIVAESTEASEVRYADAADPALKFRVFLPRERGHEYQVEHLDDRWIIRSNWQAPNFRLLEVDAGHESNRTRWRELVAHRDDAFIHGFDVFRDFLAIAERSGALRKIRIRPWDGGKDFYITSDESAYTTYLGQNAEIDSRVVRYEYTSLATPYSTYDYDVATGTRTLLKREAVLGGFDSANYRTELLWAPARDGARVPVSVVYAKDTKLDGTAPLLQYGYGSYGSSSDPEFYVPLLSLLDRGFVYAIAHIRGGQEMGRGWYEDGRLLRKKNTFTDFIDVTRFLVQARYADPKRVSASGLSAGGLLIGAVANMAPGDYRALVANVPFVDVVTTMLDESIPLVTNEFDEWGNPKDKTSYDYMLSYSPYDNVAKQDYPAMLVTTALWDSQVQYYEPAKWVARLRARKTDKNPLLFRTSTDAGHGGKSGRFESYRETAEEYAFILDQSGITQPPPAAPKSADADLAVRAGAPLFEGMGEYHRPIKTRDPGAQRYFDQGMVLAFGFNHAEAIRSFRAAQKLDPQCAMCFWGEGLATGPNINVTSKGKAVMSPADRKAAYAAAQRAVALQGHASDVERALIAALATRYDGSETSDRDPQDRAYAAAMKSVVEQFPEDDDAAAIYAEAWMNTMPWDYWSADGAPKPETVEVLNALERIIARSPRHPLALHLYVHATEASKDPGRAEQAADTLATLVPGSGHLVHMPAHIYWRVGRYHDASEANVRAAGVDEAYIAQCNAQGFYPAMYYPHNIHFLWAAATMEGRSAVALEAARKVAANVRLEQIKEFPTVEYFRTIPLVGLVQFGHWQEILAEPAAEEGLDYAAAIRHYARGVALARTGDLAGARAERAALVPLRDSVKVTFLDTNDMPATTLLKIADELLQGEIALADKSLDAAIRHFRAAVETQDTLPYMEPPFWYYPTRQSLGAALLKAGRFADAEAVYREDLEGYPHNGWSMSGLAESLEAQGKTAEAAKVREMFEHAWERADVTLQASRV